MKLTPRLEKAIRLSARLHDGQYRRSEDMLPYVSHPYSVGLILAEHAGNEDIVVGGLLHDVIEDTAYTADELEREFGRTVRELVLWVSEPQKSAGKSTLSWKERKLGYFNNLQQAPQEALWIALADKFHNLSSMLEGYERLGEMMWKDFKTKGETRWYYEEASRIFSCRLPVRLSKEYEMLLESALVMYKE